MFARCRSLVEIAEVMDGAHGAGDFGREGEAEGGKLHLRPAVVELGVLGVLVAEDVHKLADEEPCRWRMSPRPGPRLAATVEVAAQEGRRGGEERLVVLVDVVEDFVVLGEVTFGGGGEYQLDGVKHEFEAVRRQLLVDEREGESPLLIADPSTVAVVLRAGVSLRELLGEEERLDGFEKEEVGSEREKSFVDVVLLRSAKVQVALLERLVAQRTERPPFALNSPLFCTLRLFVRQRLGLGRRARERRP